MIVQFFNRERRREWSDRLSSRQRPRPRKAKLLRGDPEETAALIDSSDYAKEIHRRLPGL